MDIRLAGPGFNFCCVVPELSVCVCVFFCCVLGFVEALCSSRLLLGELLERSRRTASESYIKWKARVTLAAHPGVESISYGRLYRYRLVAVLKYHRKVILRGALA